MHSKVQTHSNDKTSLKQWSPKPATEHLHIQTHQQTHPATLIQRAKLDPGLLTPGDVLQLRRTIGNQAVGRLLAGRIQRQDEGNNENKTGLPDNLKAGIENLSGISMDDVKVHYNSSKPADINAHAFTQGKDIHIASGQEKHLPHEGWHVVQQKQGRVKPTMQAKGVSINDDEGLEHEADVMGAKALQAKSYELGGQELMEGKAIQGNRSISAQQGSPLLIQLVVSEYDHLVIDKFDVGLDSLRKSLNENGLQTAENRNIQLDSGSEKLGHHMHVFFWDKSKKGIKGALGISGSGETISIKIRMKGLSEPKWYSSGTLKGDNMGPLGGQSTTGAWAYEGDIDRKYLFIEGLDQVNQPGFESWVNGDGWPDDHAELALRRYGYEEIL